jgi:hypothetical protein
VGELPPLGDLEVLRTTRLSLHAVAEQVVAAARYGAVGRIGLRATPGGFGTPPYERDGDEEEVRVDGHELVVRRGTSTSSAPLTTIAAAAGLIGIEPGAPDVYTPTTDHPVDAPLEIDAVAADALAAWFGEVWDALEELRDQSTPDDSASDVTLWPEHFDAAMETGNESAGARGTYGASPGDAHHPEPYLYIELWSNLAEDPFWNDSAFRGASMDYSAVRDSGDAAKAVRDFFARGRELLTRRA